MRMETIQKYVYETSQICTFFFENDVCIIIFPLCVDFTTSMLEKNEMNSSGGGKSEELQK